MQKSYIFIFRNCCVWFASILNSLIASAQSDTMANLHLDEVIITAQNHPTLETKALYKVQVIDRKKINSLGANNLRELLLHELNMNVTQRSVFGSSIEIQGISKENIKILIDGVPMIGRLNGVLDLNQISLLNIQKVEIIQGPVSVIYGTDALGGVINLITKKYYDKTWSGLLSGYHETTGANNIDGKATLKIKNNSLSLMGGYYHFNGLSTLDATRTQNWEPRSQANASAQYISQIKSMRLLLASHYFDEKLISLGDTVKTRTGAKSITDVDYFTKKITYLANISGLVKSKYYVDGTVDYQDYQRYHDNYAINLANGKKELTTNDTKDQNIEKLRQYHGRMQIAGDISSNKWSWASGVEVQGEESKGARILNGKQSIITAAFYQTLQYSFRQKFDIQAAFRYSYNDAYGSAWLPALQGKWEVNPKSNIRLSLAKGFRAPGLKELYLDFKLSAGPVTYHIAGNENLKSETSNHINGYYAIQVNKKLYFEQHAFFNDIINLIVLSELVQNKRNYINIDQYSSMGTNSKLKWNLNEDLNIQIWAGVTGRYNNLSEKNKVNKYSFSPDASLALEYEIPFVNIRSNIFYKYNGKVPGFILSQNEIKEITRNDFSNMHISFNKSFLKNKVEISTGVKNLLNIQNIESYDNAGSAHATDLQLWGRTYFLKTIFQW